MIGTDNDPRGIAITPDGTKAYVTNNGSLDVTRNFQLFGGTLTAAILGEYVRSWRVEGNNWTIAQAILPGARFEFRPTPRWNVQGSFILSRGEGYHERPPGGRPTTPTRRDEP